MGDETIIAITRQLQMTLQTGDYIGRFGGDGFANHHVFLTSRKVRCGDVHVHEQLKKLSLPAPNELASHQRGVAP